MHMFKASELGLDGGEFLGAVLLGHWLSVARKGRNDKVTHQAIPLLVWRNSEGNNNLPNNEFVTHIVEDLLPKLTNWGDDEEDYEKTLVSNNELLRCLVASNGKYRELLVKDESPEVRVSVLSPMFHEILIKKRRWGEGDMINFSDVPGFEDTSYLDPLINDPDYNVRYMLAKIGIDRHVRGLLHSKNIKDVDIVLKTANQHRLDEIIAHGEEYIKTLTERNNDMTEEQLNDIAQERSEYIKTGIAKVKKSYLMD